MLQLRVYLPLLLLVAGGQPGHAALQLSHRDERFLNLLFGSTNTTTTTPSATATANTTTAAPFNPINFIGGLLFGTTTTIPPTTTTTTTVNPLNVIGGLLFGTTTMASTTTTTAAAATTTAMAAATANSTTAAPGPLSVLVGLLQGIVGGSNSSTTSSNSTALSPPVDLVNAMLAILQGNSTVSLPLAQLATLLGLSPKPIPSPLVDPIGFITNPLITPIILAALTGNIPGMLLAMGGLAGNYVLQQLLAAPTTG